MEGVYRYKEEVGRLWDEVVVDSKGYQFVDMWSSKLLSGVAFAGTVFGGVIQKRQSDTRGSCPGYTASNVVQTATGITADLSLAGAACNVYANDVQNLTLLVNYDAGIVLSDAPQTKN